MPTDQTINKVRKQPAVFTFIRYDYWSLLCLLAPVVAWGMYVATLFGFSFDRSGEGPAGGQFPEARFYLEAAIVASCICLPLLVSRVRSLSSIFRRGQPVTGHVVNVWFVSGRGRVDYTYTFNGREFTGGNATTKNERTNSLENGKEVRLLVDPQNRERAVMEDLYG